MKKIALPLLIFIIVFFLIFTVLSLGLKLSTNPADYVIQSVRHMFWQKSMISFAAGSVAGIAALLINKRK